MMKDEEYSVLFRFSSSFFYSWPALTHIFTLLSQSLGYKSIFDREVFNRSANEEQLAMIESSRICAETIIFIASGLLTSLNKALGNDKNLWASVAPKIESYSIGRLFDAAANHLRHHEEWRLAEDLSQRQTISIEMLAKILNEPIQENRHSLGFNRAIEILDAISKFSLDEFAKYICQFANNLALEYRRKRLNNI